MFAYLLHQNKLHYINQHLIGYQNVSGILNLFNGFWENRL